MRCCRSEIVRQICKPSTDYCAYRPLPRCISVNQNGGQDDEDRPLQADFPALQAKNGLLMLASLIELLLGYSSHGKDLEEFQPREFHRPQPPNQLRWRPFVGQSKNSTTTDFLAKPNEVDC